MGGSSHSSMICTSCADQRVGAVHNLFETHLWDHAGISLHAGKTRVWNRSGLSPPVCAALQRRCRVSNCHRVVRRPHTPHVSTGGRSLMSSAFCWNGSLRSPTLSRNGSSCHFARRPGQTFSCGQSKQTSQTSSLHPTTTACGSACASF